MMKLKFEWDRTKTERNWRRHGVTFDLAATVFKDPVAIEQDYGEQRFVLVGMTEARLLLFVAYTERENSIRIISARRATQHEEEDYLRQNS